ncbi:cytochrome P450 [Stereum hirsutum FP-91666 SS1]|uniref:cytochrome P450 n=1 Tax=Stereum hirsutum (strain FP-91666) TaxID=721885 RepID=UPI000440B6B7|nr:cytochrome P450 [Stereum hirsutum FP-91666 SS1]EIM91747.1 cytochrome P450 [Stereum hirsutum FP-91666 SS1]
MPSSLNIVIYAAVGLTFITAYRAFQSRKHPPYPPGPKPLPVVGNAHHMPTEKEWIAFADMAKAYGDIMHLSVLGRHIIVLSSPKAVHDLLDRRSSIYSDRPKITMAGEIIGYVDTIPLRPYDTHHRMARKYLGQALSPREVQGWHRTIQDNNMEFLRQLHVSPNTFLAQIRTLVASTVLQISHAHKVTGDDDWMLKLAERADHEFSIASTPGAFLVDVFPQLKYLPEWFPGAGFKCKAREWRKTMVQVRDEPYKYVSDLVRNGTAQPSFTASLIENNPHPTPEEEIVLKWTSVAFYAAGADTTVSAITSFFLAMLTNPEVQRKAQVEIDKVVGTARLPTFDDREELVYLDSVLKEVHRWNPVANLGIPHSLIQDDHYKGFYLPAGSVIIANNWWVGILHDPDIYPNPFDFDPARYLSQPSGQPSTVTQTNPDPRAFVFGYGRRICPGRHLAEDSLFITAATMLSVFNILPCVDDHGNPLKKQVEYTGGTISHPKPFKCRIQARSPDAERLIW